MGICTDSSLIVFLFSGPATRENNNLTKRGRKFLQFGKPLQTQDGGTGPFPSPRRSHWGRHNRGGDDGGRPSGDWTRSSADPPAAHSSRYLRDPAWREETSGAETDTRKIWTSARFSEFTRSRSTWNGCYERSTQRAMYGWYHRRQTSWWAMSP